MKILVAQLNPTVGDLSGNVEKILQSIDRGRSDGAKCVLFSELVLCGYPPEDFLLMPSFCQRMERELDRIVQATEGVAVVLGTVRPNPSKIEKPLYNSAVVIEDRKILGWQDKTLLPTYDVFDEKRYFQSGESFSLFEIAGRKVAVSLCEDIWSKSALLPGTDYGKDPVKEFSKLQPDLLLNLSGSPYSMERQKIRYRLGCDVAKRVNCPLILCNQVGGNDSLIFDGNSFGVSAEGGCIGVGARFKEELFLIDLDHPQKFNPFNGQLEDDVAAALILGIRDYAAKTGFKQCCLGLSGGIDSALVAVLAAEALGKENVYAVTMPSRYSSEGSVTDSQLLAERLGIHLIQIPIEPPFKVYSDLLEEGFGESLHSITMENLQPRIRANLLMALSNQYGYLLLSTGNKSEMAMGYTTLYGDMCGGLGVISDVPKTFVYRLAHWFNRNGELIPEAILRKPPSAELKPGQCDSDSLPDYAIIDAVLDEYIVQHSTAESISERHGYPLELVTSLIRKIHFNEYKRRQGPPGLRVTSKAFSVGRRFPIAQGFVK